LNVRLILRLFWQNPDTVEDHSRQAQIHTATLPLVVLAGLLLPGVVHFLLPGPGSLWAILSGILLAGVALGLYMHVQRGSVLLANRLSPLVLFALITLLNFQVGADRSALTLAYMLAVVLAGLVQGGRGGLRMAILCTVVSAALAALLNHGILVQRLPTPLSRWLDVVANITLYLLAVLLLRWVDHLYSETLAAARRNQQEMAEKNRALADREVSLVESEARYRGLFQNNPMPMWVYDLHTLAFLAVNEAAVRHYGYSEKEFLSMTIKDIRPPEDIPALLENIANVREGMSFAGVWRHRKKGGALLLAEITSHTLVFDGRLADMVLINDVTERETHERSIRESEARLRFVTDHMLDMVSQVGPDLRFTYLSPSIRRHLGYEPDQFLGQLASVNLHPDDIEPNRAIVRAAIVAKETSLRLEYRYRHQLGHDIWIESMVRLLYSPAGEFQGAVFASRDISERKQMEESLREAHQFYRQIISSAREGIEVLDTNLRYMLWNPYMETITGTTKEDVLGHDSGEVFPFLIEHSIPALQQRALAGETVTSQDFPFSVLNSGKSGWAVVQYVPLRNANQDVVGVLGTVSDITERKHIEQENRVQIARLESLLEVGNAITASFDLNVTLDILLRHILRQLQVDAAAILLYRPPGRLLTLARSAGFHNPLQNGALIPLEGSYAGHVAATRKTQIISPFAGHPNGKTGPLSSDRFQTYVGVPLLTRGEVMGVLEIYHRENILPQEGWLQYLHVLAEQAAIAIDSIETFEDLQRANTEMRLAYDTTIEGWANTLDMRDKETEGHSRRVTEMTVALARRFRLDEATVEQIYRGALLHDIGKIAVPDSILRKPGSLTPEEWSVMAQHPNYAYKLLSPIPFLRPALEIPYAHHEKWDGSGYPRQLKGEAIPFSARIFAIVDVWDALRSERPYRPAWPDTRVMEYLREQSGKHFDPMVADMFLKMLGDAQFATQDGNSEK
jgi:PAS domain S-box-containing protein